MIDSNEATEWALVGFLGTVGVCLLGLVCYMIACGCSI